MFTGIVETPGKVIDLKPSGSNLDIVVESQLTPDLKIDQSIAHNGVCLTVVNIGEGNYKVTAVDETLEKTNLGLLKEGDYINLERCVRLGDRMDGHLVQGHVDQTAVCSHIEDKDGSWLFSFDFEPSENSIIIPKGSICVNGVSLTVVECSENSFSVAIIPYTFEHTTFKFLKKGERVNLEFDLVGKYMKSFWEKGLGKWDYFTTKKPSSP